MWVRSNSFPRTLRATRPRVVEVDDDKLGFIASMELSPQKARILLMLALMNTNDPVKLQQVFMQY